MRVVAIGLVLACCVSGCTASRRVPSWATPNAGTAYDRHTGLPEYVTDTQSGLSMVLVPRGRYRWAGKAHITTRHSFYVSADPFTYAEIALYMMPGQSPEEPVLPEGHRWPTQAEQFFCWEVFGRDFRAQEPPQPPLTAVRCVRDP